MCFLKEMEAELVLEEWGGFLDRDMKDQGLARRDSVRKSMEVEEQGLVF